MKKYSYLLVLITISCGLFEQPVPAPRATITAHFRTDGKVDFESSSTDADSFSWDFGDGETSTTPSPSHTYLKNGEYRVVLTVKGKGGEYTTNIRIQINNIEGSAIFWMQSTEGHHIQVYLDGKYSQVITGYYSSGIAPPCGASHSATFTGLSEGKHSFQANELNAVYPSEWEGTVVVIGGDCSQMQLKY